MKWNPVSEKDRNAIAYRLNMSEFDKFSDDYEGVLSDCLSAYGESHLYYSEYKSEYLLRRVLDVGRNYKLLDYGCGIGLLSECIINRKDGVQVDGYDISVKSISKISQALQEQGIFTSDLSDLPGDYDIVVASNVMHHIPPDAREEVISMLKGLLAHNGKIVVIEHNAANPITRRIVDACVFDKDAVLLPMSEVVGYLAQSNMDILYADYMVFFPEAVKFMKIFERFLTFLPLGAQYAVVGGSRD